MNDIVPRGGALEPRRPSTELVRRLKQAERSLAMAKQRVRVDMQVMELRAEAEIMQDLRDRGRG